MTDIFLTERDADTLIVTPTVNLGELEVDETLLQKISDLLTDESIHNLVVDFHQTEYFGSTALGFFVRLWKRIRRRRGAMALCNLSEHQADILRITRLDELWPACASRADAVAAVRQPSK
jgi:anti-anti-sigma factor